MLWRFEDTKGITLRDIELSRRIALLEKQLADWEPEVKKGVQKLGKRETICYSCGKLGHIARQCKRGLGDNPNLGPKSKRLRQANQKGKAGQD